MLSTSIVLYDLHERYIYQSILVDGDSARVTVSDGDTLMNTKTSTDFFLTDIALPFQVCMNMTEHGQTLHWPKHAKRKIHRNIWSLLTYKFEYISCTVVPH